MPIQLRYLEDRWDENIARELDAPELLRYRSNLLGSDLRITNFGGGNTSSKIPAKDPLDGTEQTALWVKGSGGDLGSIQRSGLATLYLKKVLALEKSYRGVEHEDETVEMYPLCKFGNNDVAASIDTPLHGFLPSAHVDHLHPDWCIALAAAANGRERMEEFNQRFGHRLVWLPWQRPGFELAMMMRNVVGATPQCDGIVLGGHGLFTWGETQRECYLNTITIIDQFGQFILEHVEKKGASIFGGRQFETLSDRREVAIDIFPYIRGRVSAQKRLIGTFSDLPEVLRFVNSHDAERLAYLGTSCPDHFIRTKIRPFYVAWNPENDRTTLRKQIEQGLIKYREEYAQYYRAHALADSASMRDPNPTVVLVPGVGMFSFGKTKMEARITGQFYVNAIHVMEGASCLASEAPTEILPQAKTVADSAAFQVMSNYVGLPQAEAFRIEYWALEEAKIRRQPPERELSRQVALIVGGGSGIGREAVRLAAERGAHVIVADRDLEGARQTASEVSAVAGKEGVQVVSIDIRNRDSIRQALREAIANFGGLDIVINTAAMFQSSPDNRVTDQQWSLTLDLNVTANHLLVDEAAKILVEQDLTASVVLTSSANAVVAKRGSLAYDVSKAAVSHLVRELAVTLASKVRVNGVSPATVIKGSAMFPRDRVVHALLKYDIPFADEMTDEDLRKRLAEFYAERTLTHRSVDPGDCAQAILFLAGPHAGCTTGHLIPVDGGLVEAFLR
jgi:rhamnose utilization protein RhaD (predicted bifunctional aldolase and dehydrogenase)/NAD(P)-dependent dehydrogenase (short-subunit alcohol dehydrogenase family)